MGRLGTRLAKLEAMTTPLPPIIIDIWVPTDDGYRSAQSGETLAAAQFRQQHPDAFTIDIDRASAPALLEYDDA